MYIVPSDSNTASQPTSLQIFANLAVMHYSWLLSRRRAEDQLMSAETLKIVCDELIDLLEQNASKAH